MSNDYYNHGSTPVQRSTLSSALIRAEFDLVSAGFAKLPALTGNGGKLAVVDPTGTFLTVSSWRFNGAAQAVGDTAYGNNALAAANAASGSTAVGAGALALKTGANVNDAFGNSALAVCTTGGSNCAFGSGSLAGVTTGTSNVAVGNGVMYQNPLGNYNIGIGSAVMNDKTTGDANIGVGAQAMYHNVSGSNNTAVGHQAAFSYTANGIVAFGYQALTACTTGLANTAIGYNAMASCIDGGFNTAIGQSALFSVTSGTLNTGVGQGALVDVAGGGSNTAVGAGSGINITSGTQNTYLGYHAYPSANYSNSMGLGYDARPTASNQVVVGNSSVTETILRGQVKGGAGTGAGQPVMVGTLSVNSTPVGNVGAGTDDLMTYALPADSLSANNKGIRATAWGTTAANANAKTLTFAFGATTVLSKSIALGAVAIQWRVEATILRASSGAQVISALVYYGESPNSCTPFLFSASPTENEAVAITIKCTGAATADNDIVQRGMMVEFIN